MNNLTILLFAIFLNLKLLVISVNILVEISIVHTLVDIFTILVFFIASYNIYKLAKKMYGGRFTSLLPQLFAGVCLLLGKAIIELIAKVRAPEIVGMDAFFFGIQGLQIAAGMLFLSAFYY